MWKASSAPKSPNEPIAIPKDVPASKNILDIPKRAIETQADMAPTCLAAYSRRLRMMSEMDFSCSIFPSPFWPGVVPGLR